jgi:hypothetical protein
MQNGFIERFNGSYRREILDAYVFFELHEVRKITAEWMDEYNNRRPHEGLNNATPIEWLEKIRLGRVLTIPRMFLYFSPGLFLQFHHGINFCVASYVMADGKFGRAGSRHGNPGIQGKRLAWV